MITVNNVTKMEVFLFITIAFIIVSMLKQNFPVLFLSVVFLSWLLKACAMQPSEKIESLQVFQDTLATGGLGPKMVALPAGEFTMGPSPDEPIQLSKEQPRHKVTISKPFAISQFEITFADFDC